MSLENRPLILRSNRFLGSALLEREIISNEVLESANERLLEIIHSGDLRNASLLNVLMLDLKALDERVLIDHTLENEKIGAVDLENYDISNVITKELDVDVCHATYTIPFDEVEGIQMVATAYYLSRPAVAYWEDILGGRVLWYLSSVTSIVNAIERYKSAKLEAAQADTSIPKPE